MNQTLCEREMSPVFESKTLFRQKAASCGGKRLHVEVGEYPVASSHDDVVHATTGGTAKARLAAVALHPILVALAPGLLLCTSAMAVGWRVFTRPWRRAWRWAWRWAWPLAWAQRELESGALARLVERFPEVVAEVGLVLRRRATALEVLLGLANVARMPGRTAASDIGGLLLAIAGLDTHRVLCSRLVIIHGAAWQIATDAVGGAAAAFFPVVPRASIVAARHWHTHEILPDVRVAEG